MPRTPEPQPTSSTTAPSNRAVHIARIVATVVGWLPSPNAAPGSMCTARRPGGVDLQPGGHDHQIVGHPGRRRHGPPCVGDRVVDVHQPPPPPAGKPSAAAVTEATSSPSDVHSSTKSVLRPVTPALLDGQHAQGPQRIGGQFGLARRHGEDRADEIIRSGAVPRG